MECFTYWSADYVYLRIPYFQHGEAPGDSFSFEPLQRPELQILLEEAPEEMEEEI